MNMWDRMGNDDLRETQTDLAGATVASLEFPTEHELRIRFEDGRVLRCVSPYECPEEIMFVLEEPVTSAR